MRSTQAGHKQMSTAKVAEKEKGMEIQLNLKAGVFWGKDPQYIFGCRKEGGDFKMAIPTKGSSWQIIKCVAPGIT